MKTRTSIALCLLAILLSSSIALAMSECLRDRQPPITPSGLANAVPYSAPMVMLVAGDTTWVQPYTNDSFCPGDPNTGHGTEAVGGPNSLQTWCFERGPGDSCGTNPPWDTNCFKHVDVRSLPSQTGVNFWHVDTYRANQRPYCGIHALWCGSDALWQGKPVECGTWKNPPGYGKDWNCHVQLSLPSTFSVANGCTLYFDPRYDTECKYDYFYVDYWNGTQWKTLAIFNATSDNPGGRCGSPSKPNPDYYGNTDTNRLANCNWQARTNPDEPAFKAVIAPASLIITSAPKFRWRFTSDGGFDDVDGTGDTDGGAFIDNVWVRGDTERFVEDFESGVLNPTYWSLPRPPGILDAWHISHDPDPPYEGGDGGSRTTCTVDSSFVYRARPEQGYPAGVPWRNQWYYRLMSPRVPMLNTGCVVKYDEYVCAKDITCDYTLVKYRYHDPVNQVWCPWSGDEGWPCGTSCYYWYAQFRDSYPWVRSGADSMQFAWGVQDMGEPGSPCYGHHQNTDFQVDNVSIGFYDRNATRFTTRGIDWLHDSFLPQIDQGFNSFFDAYDTDSINWYRNSRHVMPKTHQLYLDVGDKDGISKVELKASINKGATWITKTMTMDIPADPAHRSLGGKYYGDVKAGDFRPGATSWNVGDEVWFYVLVTDSLSNLAYFPARANPVHPAHNGTIDDYSHFVILPQFPTSYHGPKILLVDGHNRRLYDYSPCLSTVANYYMLEDMYEKTLVDAGYCYDKYDINGAGTNQEIHPIWFTGYDAVVWFTGPYFSNYLFWKEAQVALRSYLAGGGKAVLLGDRIAFDMAPTSLGGNNEDSLSGEFLGGVMGTTYLKEMESSFTKPYLYMSAADTVNVFGSHVALHLDSVLVYRECPYLKDMSYVVANSAPPSGYTAQRLLRVLNPGSVTQADGAVYSEYKGKGQCVFVNFDLSAMINQVSTYCDGIAATPAPDFAAGTYAGRVNLMRTILETIFGLPSNGGGGTSGVVTPEPKQPAYEWALAQNSPNPVMGVTEIRYTVARAGKVGLTVYSATGQVVRHLVDETRQPGEYRLTWDGTNSRGERVSSGVYFYKLEAADYRAIKKMLLVK